MNGLECQSIKRPANHRRGCTSYVDNRNAMVVAFVLLVGVTARSYAGDPYQWMEFEGHEYAIVVGDYTWEEARVMAEAIGGHLAVINSPEEDLFIRETVALGWDDAWIGAFQAEGAAEPNGGWQWVNGDPFEYQNWLTAEPDNNNGAAVAYVVPLSDGWADETGETPYYFVAERLLGGPAGAVPAVSDWGMVILVLTILAAGSLVYSRSDNREVTNPAH
ncbi:MAG: lectin-like protein [Planctomycetota bacterium]